MRLCFEFVTCPSFEAVLIYFLRKTSFEAFFYFREKCVYKQGRFELFMLKGNNYCCSLDETFSFFHDAPLKVNESEKYVRRLMGSLL